MAGNSVKGALRWMMLAKGASQVVSWLVTLVVIRILTPADYGLFAMASMLVLLAEMMKEMGLGSALVQAKTVTPLMLRQIFTLILLVNAVLFVVIAGSAPLIAGVFDEAALEVLIPILALQFPITAFETVPEAMLSRAMDFRSKAIIAMVGAFANSIATLGFAIAGFGVWSLVLGNLCAEVARVIGYAILQRIFYLPTIRFAGIGRLVSFGGFVTLSRFLNVLLIQSSVFVVGRVLGKEILGIFSVANQLATLPMQKVSGILNEVGLAAFSRIQDDKHQVAEKYVRAMAILSFISFPVFWGLAGVAESLVDVVLGEKWSAVALPLQLIAFITPFRMIFNTTTPAILGIGRADMFFTNLLMLNLVMPFAVYAGTPWGVVGVTMAWLLAYPPMFVIMQRRYLVALDVQAGPMLKSVALSAAIGFAMLAAVLGTNEIEQVAGLPGPVTLGILVAVGAALYLGASYRLNRAQLDEFLSVAYR